MSRVFRSICIFLVFSSFSFAQQENTKPAPTPGSAADLAQRGDKLTREGKFDEALALYRQGLDKDANSYESHLGHVPAAKAALAKADNPDQARFYPYLTGYVAFYAGDYKTAIAELQKADQHDPLILALLGEAYEKSGDAARGKDYYRKVLEINFHNPTNAFARPLAKKKLGSGS